MPILIHRAALHGQYEFSQTLFKYAEDDVQATLAIQKLEIRAGEKIAILGRNGAGKSTRYNCWQACKNLYKAKLNWMGGFGFN